MIYVEVTRGSQGQGDLWEDYKNLSEQRSNFAVGQIREVTEIWNVFKDFFKKKVG